jgi:hypothetical protein
MVKLCRRLHITNSSRATYDRSQRIFIEFCEDFGKDPLGLTEDDLCSAAIHFAMQHTVRSVRSYVSAIQHLWNEHGAGELPRGPAYLLTLKGLTRLLGAADVVVRTRAISVVELKTIVEGLDPADPGSVCLALQLIVAFFLCLRTEDHTCGRLRWGDIYTQVDGSVEFLLPPGKSVKFYRHVACAARSDSLDVLTWLRRLRGLVPPSQRRPECALFVSFKPARDGRLRYWSSSRNEFISAFKMAVQTHLGFSPDLYAGYSLRRGGVTELLSRQCPLPMLKRHVGWAAGSTAVYDYYDHHGKAQMLRPTTMMGYQ